MAERNGGNPGIVAAEVVEDNGKRVPIKVSDIDIVKALDGVTFGASKGDEIRAEKDGGVLRLSLKVFEDGAPNIPLGFGSDTFCDLTPGPLWWIPESVSNGFRGGALAVDSPDRLKPIDDEGEVCEVFDLRPIEGTDGLLALFDGGKPVGYEALIFGIAYRHGVEAAYEKIKADSADDKDEGEKGEVKLAQYKTDKVFGNHSLAMKVFNGLFDIATGDKTSCDVTPRNGSSRERYSLTASEDACSKFFFNCGGNIEQIKDVLETVYVLRTSERAKECVYNGRVWFTVNTIVEEMRRTTGGTVRAKEFENDRRLVDAALLAASSAQIVGTKPNGELLDVDHVIYAVRRKSVTFNGNTYHDVWGFMPDAATLNDYAREIRQAYSYPLLKSEKPLTLNEAWVDRYLRDVINRARGKLYTVTKGGRISKSSRRKTYTLKLSWDDIFETASPMKPLESRQKQKLVKTFEKVLKLLADMEKTGEMREGMPLYINAYSERDAARGKGRGKWLKLVIECGREPNEPNEPNVNLL